MRDRKTTSKNCILCRYFCKIYSLTDFVALQGLSVDKFLNDFKDVKIAFQHDKEVELSNRLSTRKHYDTVDLIYHAIEILLARSPKTNVLSLGFKAMSERAKGNRVGLSTIQKMSTNSMVNFFKARKWELLHKHVGDDLMFFILTKSSMFLSVKYHNYVQLCGEPLHQIAMRECSCISQIVVKTIPVTQKLLSVKRKFPEKDESNKRRKLQENFEPLNFKKVADKRKQSHNLQRLDPVVKTSIVKSPRTEYLRRTRMLYSKVFVEHMHSKFELNVPMSHFGVYTLMQNVFGFADNKRKRIPKSLIAFKCLFRTIISKYKNLNIGKLLTLQCPPEKWYRKSKIKWSSQECRMRYKTAVQSFVPHHKVFLFLRRLINKLTPKELWGSLANKKTFMLVLRQFIQLGRYENLSLDYVMRGIKISDYSWSSTTKHVQETQKQHILVRKFLRWIFDEVVVPVVRSYFYVTESGIHRNRLFYYRKHIWRKILEMGMRSCKVYKPVSLSTVRHALKSGQCLGVYDIRMVPGETKLRPIANMSRCWGGGNLTERVFINHQLRSLHLALQCETARNLDLLGCSVREPTDVFMKWKKFTIDVQNTPTQNLYFVLVDINRCFDTLPQDQIVTLLREVLQTDCYKSRTYRRVKHGANGIPSKKCYRVASEGMSCDTFIDFVCAGIDNGSIVSKNSVFVDCVYTQVSDRQQLINLLVNHVTYSVGRLGNKCYRQQNGVVQGSILSTTLNNLHYGNVETRHMRPFTQRPCNALMRWVDDYLYVTSDQGLAESFVKFTHQTMQAFGCSINPSKTLVNFPMKLNGVSLSCAKEDWIPWCGYLISQSTLEFRCNYQHYIGKDIREGMTVERSSHPGLSIQRKLLQAISVKAQALFVDSTFNSHSNIMLNVYQAFSFIAIKFHVHVTAVEGSLFEHHYRFLSDLVLMRITAKFSASCKSSFNKYLVLQAARNQNSSLVSTDKVSALLVDARTVRFLCYQAFVDVLRPRQTKYKRLISLLVRHLKTLKDLRPTIDLNALQSQSTFFRQIKY